MSTDFERGHGTADPGNHDADSDVSEGRRDFLKRVLAASGTAASLGAVGCFRPRRNPAWRPARRITITSRHG